MHGFSSNARTKSTRQARRRDALEVVPASKGIEDEAVVDVVLPDDFVDVEVRVFGCRRLKITFLWNPRERSDLPPRPKCRVRAACGRSTLG